MEFFEKHIRPVLVNKCYSCHSAKAKRVRGELLLDSKEAMLKGGESGPAIVPGKVEKSLLIRALRYEKLQMPPRGKLSAKVIADFERWIAMGAPDPRTGNKTTKQSHVDPQKVKKHWAFQPIRKPAVPKVKQSQWSKSPLDAFILAQMEANGLSPSAPADRRTLIRRVYLDLIGLPPTFKEVEDFIRNKDPNAFAKVVDRLLASPHYGERWGRHWLDVARYADTKDLVLVFGKDRIRPYAYTYRDYVVRAFNEDIPFNEFVLHQLAADQMKNSIEPWQLAGMGYLTLGRLFDNNLHDIYDDQIDTVTRGFLGLTVSCARCHDHKYDPIPTEDYYSLYGIFASSERPTELPMIEPPKKSNEYRDFAERMQAKRKELDRHIEDQYKHINHLVRTQISDYLLQVSVKKADPLETVVFFLSLSPNDLRPQMVARWRKYLEKRIQPDDRVFGPWHDLMRIEEKAIPAKAGEVLSRWKKKSVNALILQSLQTAKLTKREDVVRTYGELFKQVYLEANRKNQNNKSARQELLDILNGTNSPFFYLKSHTYMYMSRVPRGRYHSLLQQMDRLAVDSPVAPARAMILRDAPDLIQPRVFLRGNPRTPGKMIPRHFLKILSDEKRTPFTHGSGRLDLARSITAKNNPLTSRVIVNRVWMHHFGEPLVATPSDFGLRSDPPTHPQLLDYLAAQFMEDGWSLKKLHRRMVLSSAYQQASTDRPECRKIDPRNQYLWRFRRQPLDFESMRDSLLFVSGRLETTIGGRPVDIVGNPQNNRRTIYGLVDRQDLPEMYRTFNFANPDQTAARRPETTVPQQALFGLNSPFMTTQAKSLAQRKEITSAKSNREKIRRLYEFVLLRRPSKTESELAEMFLQEAGEDRKGVTLSPLEQLAQVLMLTNEFMFAE